MTKKIKVQKSDVRLLLDNLPDDIKVPLKDGITSLTPDKILEHIDQKTEIGKSYYLQVAKEVYRKKARGEWNLKSGSGTIVL